MQFSDYVNLCSHVNVVYFVQHVRDVQLAISKNWPNKHHPHVAIALQCTSDM